MALIVGADLGGTWLRIGTLPTGAGAESRPQVHSYPSPDNWEDLVHLLGQFNTDDVQGFGIAISGPIHNHSRVIAAPNLAWLTGREVKRDLEHRFGKRVVVSNDMEAATEGELARGVLRRFSWAIFDTISTGWGGNLILNGVRVDGEPGHANVSFDVPQRCNAGHVGCYESLYSGSAIERQIRDHLQNSGTDVKSDVWNRFQQDVERNVPWALDLLDHLAEGVGRAWANTLNRIRPLQAIVYMGTTAESFLAIPRVMNRLSQTIRAICMFPEHQAESLPILKATLEHRGTHGAVIVYDKVK